MFCSEIVMAAKFLQFVFGLVEYNEIDLEVTEGGKFHTFFNQILGSLAFGIAQLDHISYFLKIVSLSSH